MLDALEDRLASVKDYLEFCPRVFATYKTQPSPRYIKIINPIKKNDKKCPGWLKVG